MTRIIFHIDVNSAYLSWTAVEQLKNGSKVDLRKIPSIIGGDQYSPLYERWNSLFLARLVVTNMTPATAREP